MNRQRVILTRGIHEKLNHFDQEAFLERFPSVRAKKDILGGGAIPPHKESPMTERGSLKERGER